MGINAQHPPATSRTPQLQRSQPHHVRAKLHSNTLSSLHAPTSTCSGFVRPQTLSCDLQPQARRQSCTNKDSLFQRATWDAFLADYGFILTWVACLAVCIPLVIAATVWALWQITAAVAGPLGRLVFKKVAQQLKWCLYKVGALTKWVSGQRRRAECILLKAWKLMSEKWMTNKALLPKAGQLAVHGWSVAKPILAWCWQCWCWLCKFAWRRLQQYRVSVWVVCFPVHSQRCLFAGHAHVAAQFH